MSYDPNQEKEKIYEWLSQFRDYEKQIEKKQYIQRSIQLALEEMDEFEQLYQQFLRSVQHLVVYQSLIRDPLATNMDHMIKSIRFLIEKNYTKEELDRVPEDVYQQIIKSQKQRADLLKAIATRYFIQGERENPSL
jgi:predicted ATP-dependent protease